MTAQTTGTRPAFRLMVVSTVNILTFVVVGLGGIVVNQIVYLLGHGGSVPVEGAGRSSNGWVGFMPFVVPWWYFALSGAVMLVVVVLCRERGWRWVPEFTRAALMFRTSLPFLAVVGLIAAGFQSFAVQYYDVSYAVLSPYVIGALLCLASAALALHFRARELRGSTDRGGQPRFTPYGRVLAICSAVNLGLLTAVSTVGLVVQQLVFRASTGNSTPTVVAGQFPAEVWFGHLPVPLPWGVFFASGLVTLLVSLLALAPGAWVQRSAWRPFWLSTTPGPLALVALVEFVLQFMTAPYYTDGPEQFLGSLACVAAMLVSWYATRRGVGSTRLRKAYQLGGRSESRRG